MQTLFGMGGWVTWAGVAGLTLLAIVDFVNGDSDAGSKKLMEVVVAIGIGRKADKSYKPV